MELSPENKELLEELNNLKFDIYYKEPKNTIGKKKTFRPSLEKVEKDLEGFSHEQIMYCYHKLNGRNEEAESYLSTLKFEQEAMKEELQIIELDEVD